MINRYIDRDIQTETSGGGVNNAYFNSGVFKAPVAGQFLIERDIDRSIDR